MYECPGLPPVMWQCIYHNLNTPREICNGMRVCKMLQAVLPEVLTTVSLTNAVSIARLPAICAQFTKLTFLELRQQQQSEIPYGTQPACVDFSALTFPLLSKMRITNVCSKQGSVVLDEVHFPQLQNLFVEDTDRRRGHPTLKLQLHLPSLISLELNSLEIDTPQVSACLSSFACPRLRSFRGCHLGFSHGFGSSKLSVELPWLQHFELHNSDLNALLLKAPRLMTLRLAWCESLFSITLRPDELQPCNHASTAAAEGQVVATARLGSFSESDIKGSCDAPLGGADSSAIERRCVSNGSKRIDVTVCGPGDWGQSESYPALCSDPRVRAVEWLEQYYEREDNNTGD